MRASSVGEPVDTVRGFACILLVLFHVVGQDQGSGMHLSPNHALRPLMDCLAFIRMPIFTALSGYLFAARPPTAETLRTFSLKKMRRIGVPLLVATSLFGLLRYGVYGEAFALRSYFASYQHLWFLQALLVLFLVFGLWHALGRVTRSGLILVALASSLATWALPWFDGFSLSGAIYLAPYFTFGILLRREPELLRGTEWRILALGILLIVMAVKALGTVGVVLDIPTSSLFAVLCGCAAVLLLMQRMPHVPLLASVGSFSYTIYLWHPLFGSAARQLFEHLHAVSPAVFLASLAAAIMGPIALHRGVAGVPYLFPAITGSTRRAPERPRTRIA